MRFTENGPSIPDKLLTACDQGRVVFFCGAGVSRAKANLPDFFELLQRVMDDLHVSKEDDAYKVMNASEKVSDATKVNGLISVDRIFGLLERQFRVRDIERKVAKALKPPVDVDLSAHKILIDLATHNERVKLVTTNFDRMFESCSDGIQVWQPPHLPDFSENEGLNGITYLHGRATEAYDASEGDGFVLSSSSFGRAYLSEGWATKFFREIIDRYFVVFVGYSADDPPVNYLLEAFKRTPGKLKNVYAFEEDGINPTNGWSVRGVNPIHFNNFPLLWETLEKWADRAKNVDQWYTGALKKAMDGPAKLEAYERGQVAHIVSTRDGVKALCESDEPIPAEWLCVFDSACRYATPGFLGVLHNDGEYVDPFEWYGIDSDVIPDKIEPDTRFKKRDVPPNTWSAFTLTPEDLLTSGQNNTADFFGNDGQAISPPDRLMKLGAWLSSVAHQPAALWWAVSKHSLNKETRGRIRSALRYTNGFQNKEFAKAWRYLLDHWNFLFSNDLMPGYQGGLNFYPQWDDLGKEVSEGGWNQRIVRKYAKLLMPFIQIDNAYSGSFSPPANEAEADIRELLRLEVVYPTVKENINIPEEWLSKLLPMLRRNIEEGVNLEQEIGSSEYFYAVPIHADPDPQISRDVIEDELYGSILYYTSLFERLIDFDTEAALTEFSHWNIRENIVFEHIIVWAISIECLIPPMDCGKYFLGLSNEIFWNDQYQRDVLYSLSVRWSSLSDEVRRKIEERIVAGTFQADGSKTELDVKWGTARVLDRLHWLSEKGCYLQLDLATVTDHLRKACPEWSERNVNDADRSRESRCGLVEIDENYDCLLKFDPCELIAEAQKINGFNFDKFIENSSFSGLSKAHPQLALDALKCEATKNSYPKWAWSAFLRVEARGEDAIEFVSDIVESLFSIPLDSLSEILHDLKYWFKKVSDKLEAHLPERHEAVLQFFFQILKEKPEACGTAIGVGKKDRDWGREALNSFIGSVAEIICLHPCLKGLESGALLPKKWQKLAETLLEQSGDLRRYVLVYMMYQINRFFVVDRQWTEDHLLQVLKDENEEDIQAFWDGFIWQNQVPLPELYLSLKPYLLEYACSSMSGTHRRVVSSILLFGWGHTEDESNRYVSDDELRSVILNSDDDCRVRLLNHVKLWCSGRGLIKKEVWKQMVPALFEKVWPLHRSVRSPRVTGYLCDLLFSEEERFPELFKLVYPLLSAGEMKHLFFVYQYRAHSVVSKYPEQVMEMLLAVLPDERSEWPYGIDIMIYNIEKADSRLNNDTRFIELKRRLSSLRG